MFFFSLHCRTHAVNCITLYWSMFMFSSWSNFAAVLALKCATTFVRKHKSIRWLLQCACNLILLSDSDSTSSNKDRKRELYHMTSFLHESSFFSKQTEPYNRLLLSQAQSRKFALSELVCYFVVVCLSPCPTRGVGSWFCMYRSYRGIFDLFYPFDWCSVLSLKPI